MGVLELLGERKRERIEMMNDRVSYFERFFRFFPFSFSFFFEFESEKRD